MDIEITTTKKKLTKSLISQMPNATTRAIKHGLVLGYLINCVSGMYKAYLIEHDHEYFIIADNWTRGESAVYRKVGKWSTKRDFASENDCEEWWLAYQRVRGAGSQHIYI